VPLPTFDDDGFFGRLRRLMIGTRSHA
jgi:hypothetical protein